MPRPIPRLAPVTRATLPLRFSIPPRIPTVPTGIPSCRVARSATGFVLVRARLHLCRTLRAFRTAIEVDSPTLLRAMPPLKTVPRHAINGPPVLHRQHEPLPRTLLREIDAA